MEIIFLKLCNLSVQASLLIAVIVLLRFLLKGISKSGICFLWLLVAIRLIFPFSVESALSLAPRADIVRTSDYREKIDVQTGLTIVDQPVRQSLSDHYYEEAMDPTKDKMWNPILILSYIWAAIVVIMWIYAISSFLKVRQQVKASLRMSDCIYLCDNIHTPFILGIVRPHIYLPSSIREEQMESVIAHEKTHLRRCDHFWKPLGFVLLAIYWFNPLCWLAYVLLCRDIELACDERVIREMSASQKKQYLRVLLEFSQPQSNILACPLAFGEVGVKSRVKAILNDKKPSFWIAVIMIITVIAVGVFFLTSPKEKNPEKMEAGSMESDFPDNSKIENTNQENGLKENTVEKETAVENEAEELIRIAREAHTYLFEVVAKVGLENAYPWNNTVDFKTQYGDGLIKMAEDETGEFQFYGIMSERYGTFGILMNDSIDGEENWNVEYMHWDYSGAIQHEPSLEKQEDGTLIFTFPVRGDDKVEFRSFLVDCGYDTGHMELVERKEENGSKTDIGDEVLDVQEAWYDVAYDYDMDQLLVSKEDITSIVVTQGWTGNKKTFSVIDSSNGFKDILDAYYALNVMPDEKIEHRIGYQYSLQLLDVNGEILQTVTPYKDCVSLGGAMCDGSKNGTTTQLLLLLDTLY